MTPPPIRVEREASGAELTIVGTIAKTNDERRTRGLPELAANAKLAAAARVKADDLFARQYFEHVSPTGAGPADLAREAGYEYIEIGENLALGNFSDDADLVRAWMESPGHRANILNKEYEEIGVAVGKGTFEGETTWMAVQVFGRPLPDCPKPDAVLKAQIDSF